MNKSLTLFCHPLRQARPKGLSRVSKSDCWHWFSTTATSLPIRLILCTVSNYGKSQIICWRLYKSFVASSLHPPRPATTPHCTAWQISGARRTDCPRRPLALVYDMPGSCSLAHCLLWLIVFKVQWLDGLSFDNGDSWVPALFIKIKKVFGVPS